MDLSEWHSGWSHIYRLGAGTCAAEGNVIAEIMIVLGAPNEAMTAADMIAHCKYYVLAGRGKGRNLRRH
jgi:hypothetical protein